MSDFEQQILGLICVYTQKKTAWSFSVRKLTSPDQPLGGHYKKIQSPFMNRTSDSINFALQHDFPGDHSCRSAS